MARRQRRSLSPGEAFQNNLASGAIIGAVAYAVNYVLMYLFVTIDDVDLGDEGWKTVGNVLYNAQFVDSEVTSNALDESITFNAVTKSSSNEFLQSALNQSALGDTIPTLLYHLAPFIVLALAGFVAAQQLRNLDTGSGAAAGAAIIPGTLAMSVLGVFLFESSNFNGSVAPELLMGVLLVGLILPAIAGAIGGALSGS